MLKTFFRSASNKTVVCRPIVIGLILSCGISSTVSADDWPTHLHDNQRSGKSQQTLKFPLRLRWSRKLTAPRPAWPDPAKQDYWHRKTNLRPRIVHDRAHGVVAANGRVVVSSSADDQVRAFDATTGELLWTSFAQGPIRLAPTIWKQLVVFAADDGFVYGIAADSGEQQWKTRPQEIGTRRIPGNGRIISERPIRSGVLAKADGTGYFAAGIFPQQGAFFYSIDLRNGTVLDQATITKSVQGYLEIRDGRVFAPTGRDPHGATLQGDATNDNTAKGNKANLEELPADVYCEIADAKSKYVGRENLVAAFRDGKEVWRAEVEGRAYTLAIADGMLFVSTDQGMIYAFRNDEVTSVDTPPIAHRDRNVEPPATWTERLGFMLYYEPTRRQFDEVLDVAKKSAMQVVVTLKDPSHADYFRTRLSKAGYYGKVVVHLHDDSSQPNYAKRIFQSIHGDGPAQLMECLSPFGRMNVAEETRRESLLRDTADWTHAYGNAGNTASNKARVGNEKLKLQWFGGPGPRNMVDRHMRTMPPLVSRGRMYVPGLNRVIAVDAFTGTICWDEEIPNSTRIGILKDCGWMAAQRESLYVVVDDRLLRFGPDSSGPDNSGSTLKGGPTKSIVGRVPVRERSWGFLACVGHQVIGSTTMPNASRRTINRAAILEGAYSDDRPIVCSDGLFSMHVNAATDDETPDASEIDWQYKSEGAILNPTIAASSSSVFFVENEMGDFTSTSGRIALSEFWMSKPKVVALDVATGEKRWEALLPDVENPQNAFLLCNEQRIVIVNSRNAKTVHYDVRVFDASNGDELWTTTQDNQKKLGGDHGEQDKHPVLVGNRLIVEPLAYDLDTGHKLTELNLDKRGYGCGTLSASAEALFFRSGNPASYSLKKNKIELVTSVSRPSCWINMIPAEGLLLIPEGSSGCTCNFPVQTSMAFTVD